MRVTTSLAALLLAGAAISHAQPLPRVTDDLVVTATLAPEEESDLPATVRVIDGDDARERQATTALELVEALPGVHGVSLGPPGQQASVFVRGGESDHLLVLWNGIPLNDPFFGGFNWAFLSADALDRIELVPGAGSAVYGGSAGGGVVQILTGTEPGLRGRVEGGEDDYLRASLATAGTGLGGWDGVAWEGHGHLRRGDGELDNSFWDDDELAGRVLVPVSSGGEVGLAARWHRAETGIPRAGGAPTPNRRIDSEELQIATPVTWRWEETAVEGSLSALRTDSSFSDPDDPFGFTESRTETEADRVRVVAHWEATPTVQLSGGGDAERLEVTDVSSFGPNLVGTEQETTSVFSEVSWSVDRWSATAGLRRDDNDVYGGKTSPRLGVVWSPTTELRIRASWGEGFRAPSLGELFFPGTGNPDLEPETSESTEIGLSFRRSGWTLDLVAFESRRDDLIDFDFATFTNVNRGRTRTRGIEGSVTLRQTRWRSRLSATVQDAEDLDSGLPLLRRPEESAEASVTAYLGAWTVDLFGLWIGDRPDVDPVTFERRQNPSHGRLDLAARYDTDRWLSPYARIENATGEDYEEALGFPAPGRTVVIGLAIEP